MGRNPEKRRRSMDRRGAGKRPSLHPAHPTLLFVSITVIR